MSTQLEFIMQLYMMNLLQQQQQQQQQLQFQQQQSPTKQMDITSSLATSTTTTTMQQQQLPHQQQHQQQQQLELPTTNSRTQLRKNSQNTNCSSSSSSSPNSNSSPTTIATAPAYISSSPLQQLLLNNLPPLTQLMMPPSAPPSSHILLTPTTPSTGPTNFSLSAMSALSSKSLSVADYLSGSQPQLPFSFAPTSFACNSQFSASNFLQSSTVTSTPTTETQYDQAEQSQALETLAAKDAQDAVGSAVTPFVVDGAEFAHSSSDEVGFSATRNRLSEVVELEDDEDEEEKPLSSLLSSSSGVASTSAGSAEESASKLLLCSGVQALESTTDSLDSTNMPYTPTKQPADSSFSTPQPLALCRVPTPISRSSASASASYNTNLAGDSEFSNATPLKMASSILTPPSSEQLLASSAFESSSQSTASTNVNLTTASSLDAFLQNEENLKNLKKFSSYLECENPLCRQENLREHFHCFDEPCQGKILSKKDDIIRHLKWHKKRKESLLLGFARFSSSDDCEPAYGAGCAYNWKQTHYHCVYEDCPKVYVSTSDVQMHANFHRKNSEIVQEGFRRFRAHENCKTEECPFFGKKMSHYHCCREGCNHTFKNKADMDKHKTYHLKDYQLTQDGFKKILKTESCPFEDCKFSTVCNHIHCVRENCTYILHSSSQMISHKRKHDRQDGEQAYQNYKKDKNSSEEESPATVAPAPSNQNSNATTPLSSLSAEHFLARKRGRPPKMIQLPSEHGEPKRIKLESQQEQQLMPATAMPYSLAGMFPPFLPNFNAAAAAQSLSQTQDTNVPNFQLTHLMAMFQLQNPLFYQNLYPGSMAAANVANMLSAAAAGVTPQNASTMLGSLAAFSAAAGATIKTEFNGSDKQQYKE